MRCQVAYEVSRTAMGLTRSVVFTQRRIAKQFQKQNPDSTLRVVSLCEGRIAKRGKRKF